MNVLQLPRFRLTASGNIALRDGLIRPYSGNHRKEALREYSKLADRRVKTAESELKRLAQRGANKLQGDQLAQYQTKVRLVDTLRSHAQQAKLWGAQIYDLGR